MALYLRCRGELLIIISACSFFGNEKAADEVYGDDDIYIYMYECIVIVFLFKSYHLPIYFILKLSF